jgi:serine phosphatase RsbU (regulator of sigma subunit)
VEGAGEAVRRPDVPAVIAELLRPTGDIPPNELTSIVEVARDVLGADAAKIMVADYGLLSLEPAYSIGGDSFDYALDPGGVQFAIIDAVGHGMPAVLLSVAAINALRNARREGRSISDAYAEAGSVLEAHFGNFFYVTGQIGTFDVRTGRLTWLNAGHPLPLLVRDGHVRELACRPSWPMGLRGTVAEVAVEDLQPGDTVLFYTDGAVESRPPSGEPFGLPRLIDHLAVAVQEGVAPAETVRRLSTSIVAYNDDDLSDDATLLLLEYHGLGAGDAAFRSASPGVLVHGVE